MNCYNPQCSDGSNFRRQDPMADMSSWYNDQGYPPCGMPPKKIQPLNNPAPSPAGRAAWLPPQSSVMPAGSGNVPPNMEPMPNNNGNIPAQMGPAPQMPEKDMCFGEKLSRFPIGMGYVPMQKWSQPSPINEGFFRGTIFAELDLPFLMGRCI